MEAKLSFQVPAEGLEMLVLVHRYYTVHTRPHKSVMHHHIHPRSFFSLFLFTISNFFYKHFFENFSFLRKLQIFTLRIVSRAIEWSLHTLSWGSVVQVHYKALDNMLLKFLLSIPFNYLPWSSWSCCVAFWDASEAFVTLSSQAITASFEAKRGVTTRSCHCSLPLAKISADTSANSAIPIIFG